MRVATIAVFLVTVIQPAYGRVSAEPASTPVCRVVRQGTQVELHSPYFVLRLDTTSGLRAHSWKNRLTGRTMSLGDGPELEFDIGLPGATLVTPQLEASKVEVTGQGETGEAVFWLAGVAMISLLAFRPMLTNARIEAAEAAGNQAADATEASPT